MKKSLTIAFLLAMLGLVLAPGAALVARFIPFGPIQFLTTGMLYGQVPAAKEPEISLAAISSGRAQALLEPWLAERMGLPRERLIRISNLFDFWAGRSSNPNILVGRNNELYTREQLNDWCLHGNTDYVDDLARRLVKARQRLQALGKAFVFVISPSKAAMSPANIPRYCRPPATPRAIDRLMARLPADFPVVDSETILWTAQQAGGWPAFGQYGQHWNGIGYFYATRAVVDELERQLKRTIGRLELAQVMVDDRPTGSDADTGLLLNLPVELRPTSPHAILAVKNCGEPIDVMIVGTSFSGGLIDVMMRQRLASEITLLNYFRFPVAYSSADRPGVALDQPAAALFPAALRQVNAVILEVNAPALTSLHVPALLDAVKALH